MFLNSLPWLQSLPRLAFTWSLSYLLFQHSSWALGSLTPFQSPQVHQPFLTSRSLFVFLAWNTLPLGAPTLFFKSQFKWGPQKSLPRLPYLRAFSQPSISPPCLFPAHCSSQTAISPACLFVCLLPAAHKGRGCVCLVLYDSTTAENTLNALKYLLQHCSAFLWSGKEGKEVARFHAQSK